MKGKTAKIPVKDLMDTIAFRNVVRWSTVSLAARFAASFSQENPAMISMIVTTVFGCWRIGIGHFVRGHIDDNSHRADAAYHHTTQIFLYW